MKNNDYNLWTLTKLERNDPRGCLELIVTNVTFGHVQAIKYGDNTVFVISEKQYKKLQSS
jgi:hypothetical protein